MNTKQNRADPSRDTQQDHPIESDEAKIKEQVRLGLELMENYRETLEALAKHPPEKK